MALRASDIYLVHVLDVDAVKVAKARKLIQSKRLYGPVSVDTFDGKNLPYADNLINLLIDESGKWQVAREEIERVLAPGGVSMCPMGSDTQVSGFKFQVSRDWLTYRKPVPNTIDEWTHYLHNADNNAVSSDSQVAPPKHLRWDAGPRWSRSHETDMSMTAMVSANGKLIYLIDDGPIGIHETPVTGSRRLPDKSSLVARDAYNGLILWKRPVPDWGTRSFKSDRLNWGARDLMFSSPAIMATKLTVARLTSTAMMSLGSI